MSTYSSNHPKYPKTTFLIDISGLGVGVESGVQPKFTREMILVPTSMNVNNSYFDDFSSTYFKYTDLYDNVQGYDESNTRLWRLSKILPYTMCKIGALAIQPYTTLTRNSSNYTICKFLATSNGVDYYWGFNAEWYTNFTQVMFGVIKNVNGTLQSVTSGLGIQLCMAKNSTHGITDATTATNFVNNLINDVKYIYVATTRRYSNYNDLSVITDDTELSYAIETSNGFMWTIFSASSTLGTISSVDMNDMITDTGYEPQPEPPTPSSDPYSGGGYSAGGGGGGDYDTSSDPIPIPGTPTDIASSTGIFTAYNPTSSQLASLASAIWNKDPSTFDDWWRYFFGGDAFNAIIGLSMIPVAPTVGSSKEIYLGKWGTGVSAPKITNQYKQVNFGSVTLSEFWGNAIDYSPYTRVQLALPYIGIVDVDTDDVIASVNTLAYNIDVYSGACTAMLHCVKGNLSSVIYEWNGSVLAMLPITGASFNALGSSVLAMVGSSVAAAVTALTGGTAAAVGAAGMAMAGSAASTFGSQKGKIQKSGSISGNAGALGIQTPYFIISRPVQSIPSTQQITKGYPANISAHLGDLIGYTELEEVHLHNIPGTNDEVLEIEALLKKGVIF